MIRTFRFLLLSMAAGQSFKDSSPKATKTLVILPRLSELKDVVEWGHPTCGGPLTLQMVANNTNADAIEEGLAQLLGPHTGLFLGPMMIGFITDMILCGVMTKQMMTWLAFALEDRWLIKIIVGWCVVFGAIGSVFNLAFMHHMFVYNFGRYTEMADSSWSSWLGVIAPLTSSGVQIFYCDRAYKLSGKNKLLGGIILAFILTSLIGGVGSKVTSASLADASVAGQAIIFIYLYTAGAMAADFTITTSIMWCLAHSKTGFVQTDQIVNKLLRISAETQLPPTLMAISFLIIFAYKTTKAAQHPEQFIIDVTSNLTGFFMMVMPKTYVVGFLAVLNSRMSLRAVMSSSQEPSSQWRNNAYQLRTREAETVKVTTETYVQTDSLPYPSPQTPNESHPHPFKYGHHEPNSFTSPDIIAIAETDEEADADSVHRLNYGEDGRKNRGLTWVDALK
ncbi:hypothetical protein I316_03623 [Kwoniella heveanensis BCC8398]|uniref:DUF6534 domain-containing protein n=1 Tax=Kwoniella heveanensis BCC8398 TaxID=1296120 RepID=A0A1B9GU56_9TREE|nr:hypothetical protein I316_03623 [Kwoniella heveanensis BCC8398]